MHHRARSLAWLGVGLAAAAATPHARAAPGSAIDPGAPADGAPVDAFYGAYGDRVPIDVPAYHGVEPGLALAYSSNAGPGLAGVGWNLTGFPTIQRTGDRGSAPGYGATDGFQLDGETLIPCAAAPTSPGCLAGGTHATEVESYSRIRFDGAANRWDITLRDGSRQVYNPVYVTAAGVYRWGLASVADPQGNTAAYSWWCDPGADCYPSSVAFGDYRVTAFYESRPDVAVFSNGISLGSRRQRLRSVFVWRTSGHIRAYRLGYDTAAGTARSLLATVTAYGRDVTHDGAGLITGGTAQPPLRLAYAADPGAASFTAAPLPATPAGTVEDAAWFAHRCTAVDADGLFKIQSPECGEGWTGAASTTRGLGSGDGWVEFRDTSRHWVHGAVVMGLSYLDHTTALGDLDFGILLSRDPGTFQYGLRIVENGQIVADLGDWNGNDNDVFRVAVGGGVVRYFRNGGLLYTSARPPRYPLRASASLFEPGLSGVTGVRLGGALVDIAPWCGGNAVDGDFNGDGRGDQLCDPQWGVTQVRLGNGQDFGAPATWYGAVLPHRFTGDFDGDGKTDLAGMDVFTGDFLIARSTGSGFAAAANWAGNGVCRVDGNTFVITPGDYDGDGRDDVACLRTAGDAHDGIHVGTSTGAGFVHRLWLSACTIEDRSIAADFDGDGRDDYACIGPTGRVAVQRSTGTAFEWASLTGFYLSQTCGTARWMPGDYNGDGLLDLACPDDGNVYLGRRQSFLLHSAPAAPSFCAAAGDRLTSGDFDGDGRTDWACNHAITNQAVEVKLARAGVLQPATTWISGWCTGAISTLDINGDRRSDLACGEAGSVARAGTVAAVPDLLTRRTSPLGGVTRIAYAPSSSFPNTNNPPVSPVVTAVTFEDGRGGVSTTSYSYAGGLYDRLHRRFLGFRTANLTLPCETAPCPRRGLTFVQQYGADNQVERLDERTGSGTLLRATLHEYTIATAPPYGAVKRGEWRYTFDGSGAPCPAWPCSAGKRVYSQLAHDGFGNVTSRVEHGDLDAAGDELRIERQFAPNLSAFIVDRLAAERTYNLVGGQLGPLVAWTLYNYDGAGAWNQPPAAGLLTRELRYHNDSVAFVARSYDYDARGNLLTDTDETGRVTRYTYDAAGVFPVELRTPAGDVSALQWDPICGAVTRHTDPNGQREDRFYDAQCRPTLIAAPLGDYERTTYALTADPASQHVMIERPSPSGSGAQFERHYQDGLGRIWRTESRGPRDSTIRQDRGFTARGKLAWETVAHQVGATPVVTTYAYDTLDRLTREVAPDGVPVTAIEYGLWSQTATDANGHARTTRTDARGQQVAREELDGGAPAVTRMTYDGAGHLATLVDPVGITWSWRHDTLGRLTHTVDPDAGTTVASHDGAGRLLTTTDGAGHLVTRAYDTGGRLLSTSSSDEVVTFGYSEARPGYFNAGRPTSMTDGVGALLVDHDALGRRVRTQRTIEGDSYVLQQAFHAGGELASVTYPDGDAITRLYDTAGRVRAVPGVVENIVYRASGQMERLVNTNGTTTVRRYDAGDRWLQALGTTGAAGGTVVQDLVYRRDPMGKVLEIASSEPAERWHYVYDEQNRLIEADNLGSVLPPQAYSYDRAGRMTSNSLTGEYTYPKLGEPRPHAPLVVDPGGFALTSLHYDDRGHLIARDGASATQLAWSARGRLLGDGTVSLRYDGLGERLRRRSPGTVSTFPFGDDLEITDGVMTKYVALPGIGVVAKRRGAETSWLHTDHLGSIQAITDAGGAVVHRRGYLPFGGLLGASGHHVESRGWIDQREDPSSLLTYLHARHYDARLGLFLSPDPSPPLAAGVGLNRYAYGLQDPINGTDRSGLSKISCQVRYSKVECEEETTVCGNPGGCPLPGGGQSIPRIPWPSQTPSPVPPRTPRGPGRPGGPRNPTPPPVPPPVPPPAPPPVDPPPVDPPPTDPPPSTPPPAAPRPPSLSQPEGDLLIAMGTAVFMGFRFGDAGLALPVTTRGWSSYGWGLFGFIRSTNRAAGGIQDSFTRVLCQGRHDRLCR